MTLLFLARFLFAADCDRKPPPPPKEAVAACAKLDPGDTCGFETPRGDRIDGTCEYPFEGAPLACVPEGGPPPPPPKD